MTKHRIGIIPFTYFGGANKPVGSTFLRVNGLIANVDGFEIWRHGQHYDSLIFQKVYWKEMMEVYTGVKILDLCDVDWMNGAIDIADVGSLANAITCSSTELTQLMSAYFPSKIVEHIPDRLDFNVFPYARGRHQGKAKNVTWFGFITNAYSTLSQLYDGIKKYNLNLTIISDRPYKEDDMIKSLNPQFIEYNPETAYHHIKTADIVLNPRSSIGRYKYKSNNKSVISWKLGVPVAATLEDIDRLIGPEERNLQVNNMRPVIERDYNVVKSAKQYQDIIERLLTIA